MDKTILLVVDAVSNEKSVDKEVIFDALEAALAAATKKQYADEEVEIEVAIDRKSGDYVTHRVWHVVADDHEIEFPAREIVLSEALKDDDSLEVGSTIKHEVDSVKFGRIESQMAKHIIIQKVRDAERAKIVEEYKDQVGTIVSGVVRKVTRDNIVVEIANNVEALLRKEDTINRELFRVGDRLRALLADVHPEKSGIQLFLSRVNPGFLTELFKVEVPEIEENIIQIVGAAREPGIRAKIAVRTEDSRLDPVGACVGMRGSRVQAVSNELNGERVDIILWDDNPAQFVINAMSPAEVVSIVVEEESNSMDIAVKEELLSQAIGKNGQNIRLASEVTGWQLNVMSDIDAEQKQQSEVEKVLQQFVEHLDVDEEVASLLIDAGFTSIEEIAYVPISELLMIDGFDEDIVNDLRARAKDHLLMQAIAEEDDDDSVSSLEGVSEELANALAKKGIVTKDDLAELSVDELLEFKKMSEDEAAKLIMAARASWFENEEQDA